MIDPIHFSLMTEGICEESLKSLVSRLDDQDATALLFAMLMASKLEASFSANFCVERNRIPMPSGSALVLYQIVYDPMRSEIAVVENPQQSSSINDGYWPAVVDFTLPTRWNVAAGIHFSTRSDMPIYTELRNQIRAGLEFVHLQVR
jgi:hypothetical protein